VSLNYLLIEDEPPARARLRRLIEELRPGSRCLAEAGDGVAGLTLFGTGSADVLFLDIEFPPEGAFGMLQRARGLGLSLPPIVFTTAYDHYAIEAFRWAAWDYLLKPVDRVRLEEALRRVETRRAGSLELAGLLQALDTVKQARIPERFTVTVKGRLKVLAWADVTHLCTENRLLFVHTQEGRFVLDRTLDELEALLAPRFFRCHRKAMVALDALRELVPNGSGTGEARLAGGAVLAVSRERLAELRRQLG
jgi:two-component system, LytTR family, response regulator